MSNNWEDFNFDEDFLKQAFEFADSQENNIDDAIQPVKKFCPENTEPKPVIRSKTNQILNVISNDKLKITKPAVNRKVVKRKFPGPAGILPDDIDISCAAEICDTSLSNKSAASSEIWCSQLSANCFENELWLEMMKDYGGSGGAVRLVDKYSVAWLKEKASEKKLLDQKTPFLAAVIESVDNNNTNPVAVLRDSTGEIQATIYKEVWEEYSRKLHVGSVIVLRQAGVFTTQKKHYLNITSKNIILSIYSHRSNCSQNENNSLPKHEQIEKTAVETVTIPEIIKNINDVKKKHRQTVNSSFRKPLTDTNGTINKSSNCVIRSKSSPAVQPITNENIISKLFDLAAPKSDRSEIVTSTQIDPADIEDDLRGLEASFFEDF